MVKLSEAQLLMEVKVYCRDSAEWKKMQDKV